MDVIKLFVLMYWVNLACSIITKIEHTHLTLTDFLVKGDNFVKYGAQSIGSFTSATPVAVAGSDSGCVVRQV